MLSQEMTRAAYYPNIYYRAVQTRFGAVETDYPDLYQIPLEGKVIARIDALGCLRELWGNKILQVRDLTYKLVSGNCSDDQYRKLLCSYYAKHQEFSDYVDTAVLFGDKNINLITRLIKPVREVIDNNIKTIIDNIRDSGGKVVMITHDYIYATYRHENIPSMTDTLIIK